MPSLQAFRSLIGYYLIGNCLKFWYVYTSIANSRLNFLISLAFRLLYLFICVCIKQKIDHPIFFWNLTSCGQGELLWLIQSGPQKTQTERIIIMIYSNGRNLFVMVMIKEVLKTGKNIPLILCYALLLFRYRLILTLFIQAFRNVVFQLHLNPNIQFCFFSCPILFWKLLL